MSSSYYITYGGNRLTFPGVSGSVAWEYAPPVRRYEYTLYSNPAHSGVSAGTLNSSITGFDQIMVGVGWMNNYALFGTQWKTFSVSDTTAFSLQTFIAGSGNGSYYMHYAFMTVNTANNTFTVSANTADRWAVQTPSTSNATWALNSVAAATGRLQCVTDIIGVKYR